MPYALSPAPASSDSIRHLLSLRRFSFFLFRRFSGLIILARAALAPLLRSFHQRRGLGNGFLAGDEHMAQHRVIEAEGTGQFLERFGAALDIHQHVVRLVHFLDRIGELAPSPVFQSMDRAVAGLDGRAIALDHGRHLLTLVRVDQKHHFVMSHEDPLWIGSLPLKRKARS